MEVLGEGELPPHAQQGYKIAHTHPSWMHLTRQAKHCSTRSLSCASRTMAGARARGPHREDHQRLSHDTIARDRVDFVAKFDIHNISTTAKPPTSRLMCATVCPVTVR